jgi:hypothetical protein
VDKDALEGLISVLDNWAAFFTLLVVIGVGGELVIHVLQSRANKKWETWGQTGRFLIFCHVAREIPRARRLWNPTLAQKAAQGWGTRLPCASLWGVIRTS